MAKLSPEEAADQAAELEDEPEKPEEQPEPEPEPQPEPPTFDWSQPVDDPELAQAFGKPVTLKDLRERSINAQRKITEQGTAANRAIEENRILKANLDALYRQMGAREQAAPKKPSLEDVGIGDPAETLINDPRRFGQGFAELGRRGAVEELNPRIQQLENQLQELVRVGQISQVQMVSEMARARRNVPPEIWQQRARYLYAAAGADPRGPLDVEAWIDADEGAASLYGSAPPRVQTPTEGIMRANPHGAGATQMPSRQVQQRMKVKPRESVKDLTALATRYGVSTESAAKLAEEIEADLQEEEKRARS